VHHGVNPRYLDRNYAGVFIVWDRLFGTFEPEDEAPVYGITSPLRSWNPLWANVHVFWDIIRKVTAARSWGDRWMYVFGPPGWRPDAPGGGEGPSEVGRATRVPFDPEASPALAWYGFLQFCVSLAAAVILLFNADTMPAPYLWAGGFYVTLSLAAVGGIFEMARWAGPIETARLAALGAAVAALLWTHRVGAWPAVAALAFCAVCLAWFVPQRKHLTETELAPIM
jgi:hypothetical protein